MLAAWIQKHRVILLGLLLMGFLVYLGQFMAFSTGSAPRAFVQVGNEEVAVSVGDTIRTGNLLSNGNCSADSVTVRAELPYSIKASHIEFSLGSTPCSLIVDQLTFRSELTPDEYDKYIANEGASDVTPTHEAPGSEDSTPSFPVSTNDEGGLTSAILNWLPFIPDTALATPVWRVVTAKSAWTVGALILVSTETRIGYSDSGAGSDLARMRVGRQLCWNIVWWDLDRCSTSSNTNPRSFSASTGGDFHLEYIPYEAVWPFGQDTDTSRYTPFIESTAVGQPGIWGHSCTFDPFNLDRINRSCRGWSS